MDTKCSGVHLLLGSIPVSRVTVTSTNINDSTECEHCNDAHQDLSSLLSLESTHQIEQSSIWIKTGLECAKKKTVIICLFTNAWCRSHSTNKQFLAKHLGAGLLKGEVFRLKEPTQSATTSASVSRSTRASSVCQLLMDRILLRFRQRSSCCTQMIVELEGEERLVWSVEESNGAEAWRLKHSRHALHTEKSWCQRLQTLGCWTSETTCI